MKAQQMKDHIHTLLRGGFTSLKGQRHHSCPSNFSCYMSQIFPGLCQNWWDHTSRMRWDQLSWIIICWKLLKCVVDDNVWGGRKICELSRSRFWRDFRLNFCPVYPPTELDTSPFKSDRVNPSRTEGSSLENMFMSLHKIDNINWQTDNT